MFKQIRGRMVASLCCAPYPDAILLTNTGIVTVDSDSRIDKY